jgi:hypothetical protein
MALQPGCIAEKHLVLKHHSAVEAVRYAAEHLAKRGYKLVTVDQCTGGESQIIREPLP